MHRMSRCTPMQRCVQAMGCAGEENQVDAGQRVCRLLVDGVRWCLLWKRESGGGKKKVVESKDGVCGIRA